MGWLCVPGFGCGWWSIVDHPDTGIPNLIPVWYDPASGQWFRLNCGPLGGCVWEFSEDGPWGPFHGFGDLPPGPHHELQGWPFNSPQEWVDENGVPCPGGIQACPNGHWQNYNPQYPTWYPINNPDGMGFGVSYPLGYDPDMEASELRMWLFTTWYPFAQWYFNQFGFWPEPPCGFSGDGGCWRCPYPPCGSPE